MKTIHGITSILLYSANDEAHNALLCFAMEAKITYAIEAEI